MKILIIEDNLDCAELMREAFVRESFTVDQAYDGLSGFRKSKRRVYDLIVVDVMLPHKSGFEIVSSLRSINNTTPILMVSGRGMVEDQILGLNLGADDYLVKGFDNRELLARAKALIRRKGRSGKNILRHGDLVINFSSMQARRNEVDIRLSRKEMAILIHLLRHKNRIVSRENLTESVWGEYQTALNPNTIDSHIKSLRKKLDRPFDQALIKTIRGFGYIIED